MTESTEKSGPAAAVLYLTAVLFTAGAVALGLFLHWSAAVFGPGIGLFGINAWAGAFAGFVLAVAGIWWWRAAGAGVGIGVRRVGRVVAVGAFAASLFGASQLLEISWSLTCEEQSPRICYHYGNLILEENEEEATDAFETACGIGHVDACEQFLELTSSKAVSYLICKTINGSCHWAERCRDGHERGCGHFEDPVDMPMPDAEQCRSLEETCTRYEPSTELLEEQ